MTRSIHASTKSAKRIGRPRTTGKGELIGGRWHADDLAAIDAWRLAQDDQPDRAEALRRLVRLGLGRRSLDVAPSPDTITRKVRLGLKRRGKA